MKRKTRRHQEARDQYASEAVACRIAQTAEQGIPKTVPTVEALTRGRNPEEEIVAGKQVEGVILGIRKSVGCDLITHLSQSRLVLRLIHPNHCVQKMLIGLLLLMCVYKQFSVGRRCVAYTNLKLCDLYTP